MNDKASDSDMPNDIPTLHTQRLILRPFVLADASRVQLLAGAWDVASWTANIPHPYPDGAAEHWIAGHAQAFRGGDAMPLAVCLKDGTLIGAVGLTGFRTQHAHAELGYWVGKDYWGKGYCTEAVREIVRFGFEQLGLNRVFGRHMARNLASGRVMDKAGLKYEGRLRQHLFRWQKFEDLDFRGLLKSEWANGRDVGTGAG